MTPGVLHSFAWWLALRGNRSVLPETFSPGNLWPSGAWNVNTGKEVLLRPPEVRHTDSGDWNCCLSLWLHVGESERVQPRIIDSSPKLYCLKNSFIAFSFFFSLAQVSYDACRMKNRCSVFASLLFVQLNRNFFFQNATSLEVVVAESRCKAAKYTSSWKDELHHDSLALISLVVLNFIPCRLAKFFLLIWHSYDIFFSLQPPCYPCISFYPYHLSKGAYLP